MELARSSILLTMRPRNVPKGIVAQARERYRNRLDGAAFANQTKSEQVDLTVPQRIRRHFHVSLRRSHRPNTDREERMMAVQSLDESRERGLRVGLLVGAAVLAAILAFHGALMELAHQMGDTRRI